MKRRIGPLAKPDYFSKITALIFYRFYINRFKLGSVVKNIRILFLL